MMKKVVPLLFSVALTFVGCTYHNISRCYHGKVVMTSCCTGSTFISVDGSTPIGKDTQLNGQDYSNVIQVPGYLNNGEVHMHLRDFDPTSDGSLFPIHCYCLIAIGMDVPVFVATAISYSSCPE
jgi:hypothetical protein